MSDSGLIAALASGSFVGMVCPPSQYIFWNLSSDLVLLDLSTWQCLWQRPFSFFVWWSLLQLNLLWRRPLPRPITGQIGAWMGLAQGQTHPSPDLEFRVDRVLPVPSAVPRQTDIHFMAAIKEMSANCEMSLCYLSDKIFVPFELNDKDHSFFSDTDPDLHYYNSLSQLTYKCNYYLESSFNEDIRNHGLSSNVFSLCHVNIRSISKNLGSFENYLNLLDHHFTFVGITETWLKGLQLWSLWINRV